MCLPGPHEQFLKPFLGGNDGVDDIVDYSWNIKSNDQLADFRCCVVLGDCVWHNMLSWLARYTNPTVLGELV